MSLDHRPEIEHLRALAVLSVILYHFFPKWLPGGFIGVDIFFVISGFLITRIITSGLSEGSFRLSDFYRRRIRRIFPALILVFSFLLSAGWFLLFSGEYAALGKHAIASGLFLQNILLYSESGYFDQSAETKPLLHLWSLAVEEQFYLIWPPLLIVWKRLGAKTSTLVIVLFCISLGFNLWIRHVNPSADFYWPHSRFWELLIGALLVLMPENPRKVAQAWVSGIFRVLGYGLTAIALALINAKMSFPGFWALLPTVGAGLVIASGTHFPQRTPNPATKLIAYIGRISYPLYLWHWPLLALSHILSQGAPSFEMKMAILGATAGLAILTYHGIEKPIRRDQSWKGPGFLLIAMVTIIATGTIILEHEGFPARSIESRNPTRMEHPIDGFESAADSCLGLGASKRLSSHCKVFNPKGNHESMVLWGDSSAIAWTPLLLEIARNRDSRLIVIGHPSCPPLLSARKTHFDLPDSANYCQDGQLQWEVLHLIENLKPRLIVLMGALGGYRTDLGVAREDTEFMVDREGIEADRASNLTTLEKRLPETLERLLYVAPVIMFRNWPLLPQEFPPPSQKTLGEFLKRDHPARYYPRAYFDAQRELIDKILLAHPSERLDLFDPSMRVCNGLSCSDQIGQIPAYSDRYHITPKAALRYHDELQALIERRLGK